MSQNVPDFSLFRNVLLLRTDRIGDMLVTTPAIRALRSALPNARLDVVASPLNYPAVSGNPHINSVYVYHLRKPWTWPETVLTLRRRRYDAVLVFNSDSRSSSRLASWLGIPHRIAMTGLPPRGGNYTHVPPPTGEAHVILDMLAKLEGMGVPSRSTRIDFVVPEDQAAEMRRRFPRRNGRIRLAFFLGNIKKIHNRWPVEKFRELTLRLLDSEADVDIVLLAGMLDEPLFGHFEDITDPRLSRFVGRTLQETGALLQNCDALVTGSSGPSHVATALGIPSLSLVTKYNATAWSPLGEDDVVIIPGSDTTDMRGIEVDAALDMVRGFLHRAGPAADGSGAGEKQACSMPCCPLWPTI